MSTDSNLIRPSLVMETSWEVCNKVGGIYTVLSSRAASMVKAYGKDNVLFVGPYLKETRQTGFTHNSGNADKELSRLVGLPVYLGQWNVPGEPNAVLVDYAPLYEEKSTLYYEMWEHYGIRGEIGYGDYDESCIFAVAAAMVMKAYRLTKKKNYNVLSIFNEWTTGMGLLWLKLHDPGISTVFITHATSVGRSIAGNGKNLYAYMPGYNGDQMSRELGVEAKHTIEKRAAHEADAFGTVSEVTGRECAQLLERQPDAILENGFEPLLVPGPAKRSVQRKVARERLLSIARTLYGAELFDDTLIVMTSGRFEYRNKGLDLFVESLRALAEEGEKLPKDIVALIAVPAWVKEPRRDLIYGIDTGERFTLRMSSPYLTHRLNDEDTNPLTLRLKALSRLWGHNVFPLFLPAYLDGKDGVLNLTYYETLPGIDLTVFPSYYEPWGYTPLESIAFGIPTITSDKAGFGEWTMSRISGNDISDGILVIPREDDNFTESTIRIKDTIIRYSGLNQRERKVPEEKATALSSEADWGHFFKHYEFAFDTALKKDKK
ncbi:MAG: glycosyltransferase [Porphyromonas sp.]|nr:glycosyltransferase [Bacteroidales bacterium]MDY3100891.1 glycosyltransferase [Porphyromonas sp.]